MKRSCRRWEERITRQLDGELGPREAAELAAHLERCTACRRGQAEASASRTAWREAWRAEFEGTAGLDAAAAVAAAAWRQRTVRGEPSIRLPGRLVPASWVTASALAASLGLLLWCGSSWRILRSWQRWPGSSPVFTLCDLEARPTAAEPAHGQPLPPSAPLGAAD